MQEVKIRIHGEQQDLQEDAIEVVSVGQMERDENNIVLEYDDVVDEAQNGLVEVENNIVRIGNDMVEVIKNGETRSHMVFVPEKTTYSFYTTPMGELEVSVCTEAIDREETDTGIKLRIAYELEMNHTFISKNVVIIEVEY